MNIKKLVSGVSIFLLALVMFVPSVQAATTTTIVTQNDLADNLAEVIASPGAWFFYNDQNGGSDGVEGINGSLGSFVTGPGSAPLGMGSAQITVLGDKRRNLATYQFAGVKLADITTLKFSTYNSLSGNTAGIGSNRSGYLNFNVDFNDATYFPVDSWQRRLAYVPSINGTVLQDTWQEWDAISSGNAKWWWSGFVGNGNKWPDGNTTEYRTLSDLLLVFPNMRIRVSDPWLGIRVGEPYADGYTENIDAFKFGTASDTAIFDFEPLVGPPTTYAECKGNGWKSFNNPSFTKKEKCEKYVKDNLHTIKGNDVIYTANGLKREADFNMSTAEDGSFEYDDAAKGWYNVKVSSVKVNGNLGWFAGRVVKASNPAWVGLWLFGKVEDNGPDKVWGSFTDETTAKAEVAAMSTPADGPFPVTKKDIKVK